MYSTVAYFANIAAAANNAALAAVADQVFPQSQGSNNLTVPRGRGPHKLIGALALAANLTNARVWTPSTQQWGRNQIVPFIRAAAVPTNPNYSDLRFSQFRIKEEEDIRVEASNDAGAGQDTWAVLHLAMADHVMAIPQRPSWWVRATAAVTAVANQWAGPGALTFDDALPPGMYDVIGAEIQSANTIAFRFVEPNQLYRPGGIATTALGSRGPDAQRDQMGVWFAFHPFNPPRLEIFANGASTAQVVWLHVVPQFPTVF